MAKGNQYSGKVKMYGNTYNLKSVNQVTDVDGNERCPHCKKHAQPMFEGEHVQYGLYQNKYMEFNQCPLCEYRYCLVVIRKDVVYA